MPSVPSGKSAAAGSIIAFYFLLLARSGLASYFDRDTMMNIAFLHGYGRVPLGIILVQALTVFTPEYRPVGGLYYRTLFAWFGLSPAPFRIAAIVLLGLNLALAWRWAREVSGSRFTAAVATLVFSFHPAMWELYFRDGTIYDVICCFFVLLGLTEYVRIRRQNGILSTKNLLVVIGFYGAALGSKEMAVTFPGILILYEAVFHPYWISLRERARPILVLVIMTALYMVWKLIPILMSADISQGYTPRYRLSFIGSQYVHYYGQLWFDLELRGIALCAILLFALLVALALRNRVMLFGLLFANLALLPVCVIPPRPGFVWYIPILGWALYGGAMISQLSTLLAGIVRTRVRTRSLDVGATLQAVLFARLVLVAYALEAPRAATAAASFVPEQRALENLMTAARAASPTPPAGSRILFESDPSDPTDLIPLFLLRLGYRDPTLWVESKLDLTDRDPSPDAGLYGMTIYRTRSGFRAVARPQARNAAIGLAVTPGIVHRGQTIQVQFPMAVAGCTTDVAYHMPEDELLRAGVWLSWMKLDAQGRGTAQVNRDAERGSIVIDSVRACNGAWMQARGGFVIIP